MKSKPISVKAYNIIYMGVVTVGTCSLCHTISALYNVCITVS